MSSDCRLSGLSISNTGETGSFSPAVPRPDDGQLPPGSIDVEATAHGDGCDNLSIAYVPAAGATLVSVPIGSVDDGHTFEQSVPAASAETWDLGLHSITINNFTTPIAQGTVCIVSTTSTVGQC